MADRSITLFELHLHEGVSLSATNNSPLRALRGSDEEAEEAEAEAEEMEAEMDELEEEMDELEEELEDMEESRGRGFLMLLLIGAAVGAYVAFRMLGGDDLDELEELDDLADRAAEEEETAEP
jgi:cell division protein FtsB